MTREEAKSILLNAAWLGTNEGREKIESAVEFLCGEPCDDAISRQAVLESIKNLYPDMPVMDIMGARRKWLEKYAPYFECENAVEHLPSVKPQLKTGHWIKVPNGFKCSKCLIVHSHTSIFCPSCGAKMVEQSAAKEGGT